MATVEASMAGAPERAIVVALVVVAALSVAGCRCWLPESVLVGR